MVFRLTFTQGLWAEMCPFLVYLGNITVINSSDLILNWRDTSGLPLSFLSQSPETHGHSLPTHMDLMSPFACLHIVNLHSSIALAWISSLLNKEEIPKKTPRILKMWTFIMEIYSYISQCAGILKITLLYCALISLECLVCGEKNKNLNVRQTTPNTWSDYTTRCLHSPSLICSRNACVSDAVCKSDGNE